MGCLSESDHILAFIKDLYTCFLFNVASITAFSLVFSYFVIKFIRESWLSFLEKRFPELEFDRSVSLRTVLDSQNNQGIIIALLAVKGRSDISHFIQRLEEDVINKRHENKKLFYPRLRKSLTTRWGWYAWAANPFRIENHVVLSKSIFKGRPITENNIQEYANYLVGKEFKPDAPPWKIHIIPISEEKYFILTKVHHLMFSKLSGMGITSILPISTQNLDFVVMGGTIRRTHPFRDLYRQPRSLPLLFDKISQSFSNRWNEFLAHYDPLQNPENLKQPAELFNICAALLIATILTVKKFYFTRIEYQKRNLTFSLISRCFWTSISPFQLSLTILKLVYKILKMIFVKIPVICICEIWAFWKINDERYSDRSFIKTVLEGWQEVQSSLREAWYFSKITYNFPRVLFDDLFCKHQTSPHYLQKIPNEGKKVISWSKPMPIEVIRDLEEATGASTCDIILTATIAAIRDFFTFNGMTVPNTLLATGRAVTQTKLLSRHHITGIEEQGIVCLALPTQSLWEEDGPISDLHTMQQMVLKTRLRQLPIYLISGLQTKYNLYTKCIPFHLVRYLARKLSRRYAVSITDVYHPFIESRKHYLWGQEVQEFMYWDTLQASTSLGITLMSFGDNITIGVMCDEKLSPQHNIISSTFPGHIRRLATAAGVAADLHRSFHYPVDDGDDENADSRSHTRSCSVSSSVSLSSLENEK